MTTIPKLITRTTLIALFAIGVPLAAAAQGSPTPCSAAQDSLNAGVFLWNGTLELAQCGSAGATSLATLINQSATAPLDTSFRFGRLLGLARDIVSPVVTTAALAVAQGTGNTQIARVTAFQILLAQYDNSQGLQPAALGDQVENCQFFVGTTRTTPTYNAGLTPQVLQQMMAGASTVYHNAGDDAVVRSAAFCLRTSLHHSTAYPVNTSLITLSYVCSDQFKVHNTNPEAVPLSWNTYHVPPNARTVAPTLTSGQILAPPNGDMTFRTDSIATARLYYGTTLIQTRANGGTGCP
jgi:hypothetical protein